MREYHIILHCLFRTQQNCLISNSYSSAQFLVYFVRNLVLDRVFVTLVEICQFCFCLFYWATYKLMRSNLFHPHTHCHSTLSMAMIMLLKIMMMMTMKQNKVKIKCNVYFLIILCCFSYGCKLWGKNYSHINFSSILMNI